MARREFAGGNWKVIRYNDGNITVGSDDGHGAFANVRMRRSKMNNLTELRANANLVIAAPRFYDASVKTIEGLTEIRETLDPSGPHPLIDLLIAEHKAALELADKQS